MQEKTSQIKILLAHFEMNSSITQNEAMELYGIGRLGARIHDLRKLGYPIYTKHENGINRYGNPTRYARYYVNEYHVL